MFKRNHVFAIAAVAAFSILSLTACSDENSDITNVPDESELSSSSTPSVELESSSSSGLELSSSSAPSIESSSSSKKSGDSVQVELKCDYETKGAKTRFLVKQSGVVLKDVCSEPSPDIDDDVYAEDCNAENGGRVLPLWRGNAKYGGMSYYKCQKDSWVEGDIRLTCDTTGVAVGDLCHKTGTMGIFRASMPNSGPSEYVFVYAGDGVWKEVQGYFEMTKKCTAENQGEKEKFVVGKESDVITSYYACSNGKWTEISEKDYHCATEKAVVGDTCSFESENGMLHYLFMHSDHQNLNFWVESKVDSELGFCPIYYFSYSHEDWIYRKKGDKYYLCKSGEWLQKDLVPRQYTDSRKEGLTDEEFDMLDLPKDAKVGDRVGGLLESCWYDDESSYCKPQNYYRYRGNGSWTVETEENL